MADTTDRSTTAEAWDLAHRAADIADRIRPGAGDRYRQHAHRLHDQHVKGR